MKEPTNEKQIIEVPQDDKTTVEITPFGTDERIRLNVKIVQTMIATPTKTGKLPDTNQCIRFIMLCRARHLNPFEGDVYMLGYDTQNGPQFSLITAHQVFLKRAEASDGFDGMESGVIVEGPEKGKHEREGDLVYENEKLIGGWAKVYRKDRKYPFYRRLQFSTFNTGQSRWLKDPAGMIVKCAEADALRSAFPTHLGGLYVAEERPPIDISSESIPIERPKIGSRKQQDVGGEAKQQLGNAADNAGGSTSASSAPSGNMEPHLSQELALELSARIVEAGYTTNDFMRLAADNHWIALPAGMKPNGLPLSAIDANKLAQFLDDEHWPNVIKEMEAAYKPTTEKDQLFA